MKRFDNYIENMPGTTVVSSRSVRMGFNDACADSRPCLWDFDLMTSPHHLLTDDGVDLVAAVAPGMTAMVLIERLAQ